MKRITALLAAGAIFALNLYICWGLFSIEYLAHMGSVEGSFIGLARYVKDHSNDLTWFALWHLGMPYANSYPPLLHWGVAAVSSSTGMSVAHGFHWVAALTYCLGPVALFALALRLTKSLPAAFAAAAMYSVVSWSAWLMPQIAADLGSRLHPRRLQALVLYGETPHIASMTLLPLAVLCWDLAFQRRRAIFITLAALSTAATVLTSWLGGFALSAMIIALAITRKLTGRDVALMVVVAVAAYGLAMPFALPSTIAAAQFNSKTLGGDFRETYLTLPKWLLGVALLLGLVKLAVRKLGRDLQFAIFFTILIAAIVFPWAWFGISAVPQPVRYHLELEMALSLLVAIGARALLPGRAAAIALALLCVLLIQPVRASRRYARGYLIRPIDITATSEYKIGQWLNREWTGERVMMSGSVAFWQTAFSDVPALNGGPEQGVINFTPRMADYGIYYGVPYSGGHNGEFSVLWLKALGVQAVGVSGPASGEHYKPYLDPHQFDGLLHPIYNGRGDTIYRVGAPRTALARVLPRHALVSRMPKNFVDVDPLRPYVAALDDPGMPKASFTWTSLHSAHISADLSPDQVVSVQINWHKGWRASVPVNKDAIGLVYLDPRLSGHFETDLIFDGGIELRIARWISGFTAFVLAIATTRGILKKSW